MAVPAAFFAVSVFAIAQSAIAVKAYNDTNKAKDPSYYFSAGILTISIIALLASAYMAYKAYNGGAAATATGGATTTPPSAVAGSVTNTGGAPLQQTLGAMANKAANQAANQAAVANSLKGAERALAKVAQPST